MVMELEQALLEKLRSLPQEKRQEVLDFVEFLARRRSERAASEDLYGLWADLGISISTEDLTEARREMWTDFPKADL